MKTTQTRSLATAFPLFLGCLGILAVLAGCAGHDDPFEREGTWRAEHDNDANLAAMVSNKHDLVQGVDDPNSPGVLSANAVRRLLTDKVKALPSTEIGPVSASGSQGASGGGGS